MSPVRALATCVFAIGLPQSLFRQLGLHQSRLSDVLPREPRVREWRVSVPRSPGASPRQKWKWAVTSRRRALKAAAVDAAVLALAGVMLWQNVALGRQSMVTWRCEYSWLLLCWPVACAAWLAVALGLLAALARDVRIRFTEDGPGVRRSWADLLRLMYRVPEPRGAPPLDRGRQISGVKDGQRRKERADGDEVREVMPGSDEPAFVLTITMRYDTAWRWYEAAIEALAVGIYLYATFVLTSSLFISGSVGIVYMTTMVLCLSAIRIVEAI